MVPKTDPIPLIYGKPMEIGYERPGEDHSKLLRTAAEAEELWPGIRKEMGIEDESMISAETLTFLKSLARNLPFEEGAWMTKYGNRYYLQYACPGTEYNVYGDGCYISESPLGPFHLAENNPYSYHPGGFFPGAGHGSTMWDVYGNLWHTATMRISKNADMERRVGLWPAGFDEDGNLFCNQRYGDWPIAIEDNSAGIFSADLLSQNPWKEPEWYPLHIGKTATASSWEEGKGPEMAIEENVQTWWRAGADTNSLSPEWLQVDLGHPLDVRAIQINFADDGLDLPVPEINQPGMGGRYIDDTDHTTRWKLEGSLDGRVYFMIEDKSQADTDLPHDFLVREAGIAVRYVKLTIIHLPYDQIPAVSGLRIFGIGVGSKPKAPDFEAFRTADTDMLITIYSDLADSDESGKQSEKPSGYNILWGIAPDKLYHSYMIFTEMGKCHYEKQIGALVKGQEYYIRVDAFNENGITQGKKVIKL